MSMLTLQNITTTDNNNQLLTETFLYGAIPSHLHPEAGKLGLQAKASLLPVFVNSFTATPLMLIHLHFVCDDCGTETE